MYLISVLLLLSIQYAGIDHQSYDILKYLLHYNVYMIRLISKFQPLIPPTAVTRLNVVSLLYYLLL